MMIAIKNDGAEMPAMLANTAEVSNQVPFLTAAITPKNIPTIVANNMAVMASINVPGNASISTEPTLFFV